MKKLVSYFGIIAAAAFVFSSCAREIDNPLEDNRSEAIQEGGDFELTAAPVTKTSTDGLVTNWVANDAINVFHAVSGSTDYVDDEDFTIASADLASGTFRGTLGSAPASGNTYDWYAIYPYSAYLVDVDNTGEARYYIGKRSDQAQVQTGNSSTAHLSGENFPLFGKATGVAYDAKPSVSLSHIASIIEVNVTNKKDDPLTVTNVSFTAPEGSEIVGNYIINFEANPMTFTKYSTYVSDVANLTVSGGSAIAKDASATFYIGVKPFSTTSGQDIKVSVNGYEKTIHTTKNFTFASGKIKTVNFDYDNPVSLFTWDLSTNSYSAQSETQVTWSHDKATMVADKSSASTPANNYLGGTNSKTSSRFYSNSNLTFTPATGYQITKVEVTATSNSYANALKNSTWTNANAVVSDETVTITPLDGTNAFYAKLGGTVGATSVTVYYRVPKVLTGIEVTTPPTKTNYKVGESIDLTGAVVTATYDDSSTEDVTASVTTDAATVLAHPGNSKTVTVSYLGETSTFLVNVAKGDAGIAYAVASYTVAPDADFDTPVLTNPHGLTISYSSSDENLVLVDENTGDIVIGSTLGGPVTITATATANDDYNGGTASYTITISNLVDYSNLHTSNVTLSTSGGTNATASTVVIGGSNYDALKAGTTKNAGAIKITVPSGTTKLYMHIAGWNGESVTVGITPTAKVSKINNVTATSMSLTADSGISGSGSTFTINATGKVSTDYYKVVDLTGITTDTDLTFTATSGKRFVVWGVNAQ